MDNYVPNTGVISVNADLVEVGVIRTDEEQTIARSVCHVCGLIPEKEHDHEKGAERSIMTPRSDGSGFGRGC